MSVVGLLVNLSFQEVYPTVGTGFFLHFPNLCLGCVCHNSRRTKYFLISCNEELVLPLIYRTDDAKSLVQRLCDIVVNKLSCDTTVYCIQFIACTCQISEGVNQKILRCYKSSKLNKKEIAMKKRKSYAELEPVKKKLCLERSCHYYTNVKNKKKDCKDL